MRFITSLLCSFLFFSTAFGQEIPTLADFESSDSLMNQLNRAIDQVPKESKEAFTLYSRAAQRFVARGNYENAEALFIKAEALAKYEPDSSAVIEMATSKATMHKEEGRFTISLSAYMEALAYYKKQGDVNGQLWIYGYLSEFYRATSNAELCLKFIEEGEALMDANDIDLLPRAYISFRRASYYLQFFDRGIKINFERALDHLEKSKALAEETRDSYLLGLNQNSLGFLLMHNAPEESEKIIDYLEAAKVHMLVNERFRNYGGVLHTLALHYTRSGHPEKAVDMTFEIINLSKENNWISTLSDYYRLAGEVFYELGRYEESAKYLNEALMTSKEAMAKTHSIELGELSTSLERNIAEQKLMEQESILLSAQQRDKNSRQALIATILIALLSLAVTFVSVRLYFRFRKKNKLLRTQQEIIQLTNAQLTDAVNQKNTLYRELNHRVKNNLTILTGLIYLQESREGDPAHQNLYQTLRHRIQSMALVHQNLYAFNEVQKINFHDYIRQLTPDIASTFQDEKNVVTVISCENLTVDIDEAVPLAMIINELMTNSFKHAFEQESKGEIKIWSDLEDEARVIRYKDNGIGMPADMKEESLHTLGIRLINLMVQQLKGRLTHENVERGVYFKIELPLPG